MKIDPTKVRPILKPKNPQVIDPPRFPKLIIPIETEVKQAFAIQMNKLLVDITKRMVELKK